jgi:hypothetical protein
VEELRLDENDAMSNEEGPYTEHEQRALTRTNVPGLFLIVTGILNMVAALMLLLTGVQHSRMAPDEFERAMPADQLKELQKQGWTVEQLKRLVSTIVLVWGSITLASAFVICYGGANMRSLNSYTVAVLGAVLAAVPFISPLGCCGIGEVVGIWCLAILLNPEVSSAFP